jgi:excisionase family DNA binding protein
LARKSVSGFLIVAQERNDGAGRENYSIKAVCDAERRTEMNSATEAGLIALLQADRSIPAERIPIIMEAAKGRLPEQPVQGSGREYLTIKEACSLLRCCRMTLYRLEKDGAIECIYLRGKKLFERAELLRALKKGCRRS